LYHEEKADDTKAVAYFRKACDMGQSQSCRHLGDIYRK
jgi:TPR repeat protein